MKRRNPQQPSQNNPQPPSGAARPAPTGSTATGVQRKRKRGRLLSLDAYRGFIMVMLAAAGFGIHQFTQLPPEAPVWNELDYDTWQQIGFHFAHAQWTSNFDWIGISFWDLIQPAFMFMVGVAMPFSYARRASVGHSAWRRTAHAVWRALVLVLLGVFLSSNWADQTNWTFVNVLCQIGLGYVFVYALMGRKFWVQLSVFALILVGYWGLFYFYAPPGDYDYAAVGASEETVFEGRFVSWSKNANVGHHADVWLLNQFPRPEGEPFVYNEGGYVTLNFVPSIATMLLGVFCGQLLRSERRWWEKFLLLVVGGAVCLGLGALAGEYVCPIVKRIWTPSWVLFSGGWVIWMLAAFYFVFDLCRLRWIALPLAVVGMNSLAMYMMGQLLRPWATKTVKIHFADAFQNLVGPAVMADDMYGRIIAPTSAFLVFWLIALWMYRQKFFVRV
jgi:predicted acyltransferase